MLFLQYDIFTIFSGESQSALVKDNALPVLLPVLPVYSQKEKNIVTDKRSI